MSNSSVRTGFDFRKRVAYDDNAKRLFHHHARRQLRLLADALSLAPGSFDLRKNKGGIAPFPAKQRFAVWYTEVIGARGSCRQ
jgi:hypothetical protein